MAHLAISLPRRACQRRGRGGKHYMSFWCPCTPSNKGPALVSPLLNTFKLGRLRCFTKHACFLATVRFSFQRAWALFNFWFGFSFVEILAGNEPHPEEFLQIFHKQTAPLLPELSQMDFIGQPLAEDSRKLKAFASSLPLFQSSTHWSASLAFCVLFSGAHLCGAVCLWSICFIFFQMVRDKN